MPNLISILTILKINILRFLPIFIVRTFHWVTTDLLSFVIAKQATEQYYRLADLKVSCLSNVYGKPSSTWVWISCKSYRRLLMSSTGQEVAILPEAPANFEEISLNSISRCIPSAYYHAPPKYRSFEKSFIQWGTLMLFPYPRSHRRLKFTQETTENYTRVNNTHSQPPAVQRWNTASTLLDLRIVESLRGWIFL